MGIVVLVLLLPGWIDWLGLMGAAWALTLSWLVTVLLSLAAVLREVRRCRQCSRLDGREACGKGCSDLGLPAESLDFLPRDCRNLVGGKPISDFSLPIGFPR